MPKPRTGTLNPRHEDDAARLALLGPSQKFSAGTPDSGVYATSPSSDTAAAELVAPSSSTGLNHRSRCSRCQVNFGVSLLFTSVDTCCAPVDSSWVAAASRSSVLPGHSNLHRQSDWYGKGSVSGPYPLAMFVIAVSSRRGCEPSAPMPTRRVVTKR